MLRKQLRILWIVLAACLAGMTSADDIDGPDMYVYVEVSVREITLEGMRQRLALLQSSDYSVASDNTLDAQTRVQIADIYAQFGTTAGAHLAYGTRHVAQIEEWLEQNPTWKDRYAALDTQFRSLSDQLSALRQAQ
jgi:hypothetical protein